LTCADRVLVEICDLLCAVTLPGHVRKVLSLRVRCWPKNELLTIAQMLGHSSTQIVPRYAQVLDQNRLDAMKKLEELKKSTITGQQTAESGADQSTDGLRQ
jgi:hypothetical protein